MPTARRLSKTPMDEEQAQYEAEMEAQRLAEQEAVEAEANAANAEAENHE